MTLKKSFSSLKLILLCGLILLFASLRPKDVNAQTEFQIGMDVECSCKKHARSSFSHLKSTENYIGKEYDIKYHRFRWFVLPDTIYISGSVFSIFEIKEPVNSIDFQLSANMVVDSVKYHNSLVDFSHNSEDQLRCLLPGELGIGVIDSIQVYYHGSPDDPAAFNLHYHYLGADSIPSLWTLSEPYGAKSWWPCKNHLSDKIDSTDFIITTSKPYRVAGSGLLVEESHEGDYSTFHWKHRYPIPAYLIFLAVSEYAVFDEYFHHQDDSLHILNYVYPIDSVKTHKSVKALLPAFGMMTQLFGVYPFQTEKYGHVQMGRGGGMEHQTMTSMGTWSYDVIVHEAAHQWFGNYITCASWHDIWLNEAFATYITGLAYERVVDTDIWWRRWREIVSERIMSEPGGSVYVKDTTDVGRIFSGRLTYYKGAYVLHMLRWVVGDENFFYAISNYLNDPANVYGYATTDNLKMHFEQAFGSDLGWFFDQWYYGEGYPEYEFYIEQLNDDYIEVEILQEQSLEEVGFFSMPVPLQFWHQGIDTTLIFDNQFSGQVFTRELGFRYDSVLFDPELWLLSSNNKIHNLQFNKKEVLLAYPNPSKGNLKLYFEQEKYEKLYLYSLKGERLVVVEGEDVVAGKVRVNCEHLANGTYIVVLINGNESVTRKVVVLK